MDHMMSQQFRPSVERVSSPTSSIMSGALRTRSNRVIAGLFFVLSRAAHGSPIFAAAEDERPAIGSSQFWWKIVVSMGLVLLGGAFAG